MALIQSTLNLTRHNSAFDTAHGRTQTFIIFYQTINFIRDDKLASTPGLKNVCCNSTSQTTSMPNFIQFDSGFMASLCNKHPPKLLHKLVSINHQVFSLFRTCLKFSKQHTIDKLTT